MDRITLYKVNSKGKTQSWSCSVTDNKIFLWFGEVGGKQQTSMETIKAGKNIGKASETTKEEQAELEGKALVTKKLKAGYTRTMGAAQAGETDEVIEGGALPMLAHSYEDHKSKVVFPCFVQPKLDGIRCIAVKKGGDITLWTRTRKPITSCPHIIKALKQVLNRCGNVTLDGELYNHDLKDQFEKIVSGVRVKEANEWSLKTEYHIYDVMPSNVEQNVRLEWLETKLTSSDCHPLIKPVYYSIAEDHDEIETMAIAHVDNGYEGAMIRTYNGLYENKKSYNLLKHKTFMDDEFLVIGVVEGRGKLSGKLGAFICETKERKSFTVTPEGNIDRYTHCLKNPKAWKGKYLQVKFFRYTGKNKVPYIPKAIRFRDEVDF